MILALMATETQLPIELAAAENDVLVFVPTELIAIKQTAMITANMTEYSTAVGPSSDRTNLAVRLMNRRMAWLPMCPKK